MQYEIKNRYTGAVLFSLECDSLKLCVEAAVSAKTNLRGAYLSGAYLGGADLGGAYLGGADLRGADLGGAYLGGADLIDGGQDKRGYRFYVWRNAEGVIVYRAGCHEWDSIETALAHYSETYTSNGDRHECLARLTLLRDEAARRWTTEAAKANAA